MRCSWLQEGHTCRGGVDRIVQVSAAPCFFAAVMLGATRPSSAYVSVLVKVHAWTGQSERAKLFSVASTRKGGTTTAYGISGGPPATYGRFVWLWRFRDQRRYAAHAGLRGTLSQAAESVCVLTFRVAPPTQVQNSLYLWEPAGGPVEEPKVLRTLSGSMSRVVKGRPRRAREVVIRRRGRNR